MKPYFEGTYYKHQNGVDTIAFIPGEADDGQFIQVIRSEERRVGKEC